VPRCRSRWSVRCKKWSARPSPWWSARPRTPQTAMRTWWRTTRTGARTNGPSFPKSSRFLLARFSTSPTTPVRTNGPAVPPPGRLVWRAAWLAPQPRGRRTNAALLLTLGDAGVGAALEVIVIVAILINTITLAVQVRAILFPDCSGLGRSALARCAVTLTRCAVAVRTPATSSITRTPGSTRSWTSLISFSLRSSREHCPPR
jgi:hypothetical protein